MHFVRCKTVREYNRNQEKIKEFLLTEKKNQKNQLSKKLTDHAPESQFHMDQPGPSRAGESNLQKDQPGSSGSQRTQPAKAPKQPRRKGTAPTKRAQKPNKEFEIRSKEAALAQTKLEKAKQRQKDKARSSLIKLDMKKLQRDNSVQIINLASDSSQDSPLQILTSNNPNAFMYAQPKNKDDSPSKREAKIDKIIKKITNSPKKATAEPVEEQIITIIPASTSTPIGDNTKAQQPIDNKQPPQHIGNSEVTQQQNIDKHTTQPTGSSISINTTSTLQKDKINPPVQPNKGSIDPPEERQDTNTERENTHTEEEEDEYSGTSSISSLNTADIEALNKIFD